MSRKQVARTAITIREVAREAGVSTATVSRVLSGHDDVVSEGLAERVRAVANRLRYQPNRAARSLRAQKNNLVGVVLPGPLDSFFSGVLEGIDRWLQDHDHALVLAHSQDNPARHRICIERFVAQGASGIIVATPSTLSHLPAGFPLATIDCERSPEEGDTIGVNDFDGAQLGIAHLLKLGHRRIGLVAGPAGIPTTSQRLQGCLAALKKAGLPLREHLLVHAPLSHEGGFHAATRLAEQPKAERPTAVFVMHDKLMQGVLRLLRDRHIEIPRDLALVGFGDSPWMAEHAPRLTVIAQPSRELGRMAAQSILLRIETPSRPSNHLLLDAELVIRESCGAMAPGPLSIESSIYHSAVVLPGTKTKSE
ncbi:MAG: LacI family DNA-binding transcriptional regulator [Deltaproteobacteria bacterium]|nr:LacI family DNA-binding transcriptional regulator [Deltaproteobacteria bacterium]